MSGNKFRNLILLIALSAAGNGNIQAQQHTSSAAANAGVITLGHTVQIHSDILSENRTINIYLPPDYDEQDTARYPVIYLLDGGLDEDFIHVAGLIQYSTFPWVGRLRPSILVGVGNTDRKRDMTFPTTVQIDKKEFPTTGGSAAFINFLGRELKPYIEKQYRTSRSATLIGESLGGLLATEILFKKPELFSRYIIVSPSLWWDNGSLLRIPVKLSATVPGTQTDVYVGVGKEGVAPSPEPHVMEVDANVLADKLRSLHNANLKVYFDYLPDENHATVMYPALYNAFRILRPSGGKP